MQLLAAMFELRILFLVFVSLPVVVVVSATAGVGVGGGDDRVWQKRAHEAKVAARHAYHPDPHSIVNHFNERLHSDKTSENGTRRELRKHTGPCLATNPIDRCWRCDQNWAANRMKLADCSIGFGRHTTGGKGGEIYAVTDPSDNDLVNPKPGTLRHAVIQPGPLWIIFSRSMTIRLSEELLVTSDTTIDGRGATVAIVGGAGFTLQFVKNVIIHNIKIHDIKSGNGGMIRDSTTHYGFRTRSDGDGVSIFGSSNIWLDHLSMSNCVDGLIDVVQGSTAVTISNCHFTHHNEVLLFGASNTYSEDSIMQVTVAFNHFGKGLMQRMPRVRWGFVHVVNNDYTQWLEYAIGGSQHPTIISQGNRFVASANPFTKEVTRRGYAPESEWKTWLWKSEQDLMVNGAFFVQSGDLHQKIQGFRKKDFLSPKPGSSVSRLTRFSGALKCLVNTPC
ncbi:pectate lyase-like [Diospyros lotus]|uniref:pectate lyase-like n=1 Tax=Diospyros lotus TaxID=55363 RepID=UPI0022576A46|nr:pectate lyase-like [Diospyros lotus]